MKRFLFVRHGNYPNDIRAKKQVHALIDSGFEVDVICLRKKGQSRTENINNVNVLRLPLQHKRASFLRYVLEYSIGFVMFFTLISFKYLLKKYDFIIVHTLPDYLTFSTILPKMLGTKIVTDFHEPTPELIMTKYSLTKNHILVKSAVFIEQLVIRYSDFSITVTNALRQRYIDSGANPDKVHVISNVIDDADIKKSTTIGKVEKLNYTFRIIMHGAIEERYGHETVIRAVNELKEKFPQLKFIITGDGTHKIKLQKLVAELDCQKNVDFLGYLTFDELIKNLVQSNVGIVSMFKTPYSMLIDTNKMYEFLELGLPVILPKLPPLEENFNNSEVMFFEPGNYTMLAEQIELLIQNPLIAKQLVENASKKYQSLKWSLVKKTFLNLFNNPENLSLNNTNLK